MRPPTTLLTLLTLLVVPAAAAGKGIAPDALQPAAPDAAIAASSFGTEDVTVLRGRINANEYVLFLRCQVILNDAVTCPVLISRARAEGGGQ